jgi:hypothetical protein
VIRSFLVGRRLLLVTLVSLLGIACVVISSRTTQEFVEPATLRSTRVRTAIKAHLMDGGLIVFPNGAVISATAVEGTGRRHNLLRTTESPSGGIALDSIIGFEVYERRVNPIRTLVYTSASTVAAGFAAAVIAIAIFGSCPTIYADSAGTPTLQAESFSYSISPLLAKRDVDRMSVRPDSAGVIRLAVRNEALETHHLDHMEIIELRHRPDELALPAPRGGALVVSDIASSAAVRDAAGRDVGRIVARADEAAFSTDSRYLDRAIAGGPLEDHLVISIPARPGTDSVALVLRARSSLLTTSVLYEHLMGRQGALALDWMADLSRITSLARLATWYAGNFGMRVEVQDGDGWRQVVRLMNFGPTAWRTIGVALPAERGQRDSIRVRVSFIADAYRIDQLSIASRLRRVEQRRIGIARAVGSDGRARADIVTMLARADDREVETHPGDQFWIEFDAGRDAGESRTFLFAGQGYYVEWLRPAWMRNAKSAEPFSPSRTSMPELLRSWRGGRDSLEAFFFARKVPVT